MFRHLIAANVDLRVHGDEERGYLVIGLEDFADADVEFWFATLDDALRAAERAADVGGWEEVTSAPPPRFD